MSVRIELGASASPHAAAEDTASDRPFCVAILGDFSGRRNRGLCEPTTIAQRRPISVDPDNYRQLPARLQTAISLQIDDSSADDLLALDIQDIDDFHPDRIFDRVPLFAELRTMRQRLLDPATSAETVACLSHREPSQPASSDQPPQTRDSEPDPVAAADLLDAALEATDSNTAGSQSSSVVDRLIQRIVAPHLVPRPDARQDELVAGVDAAIGGQMRRLLHSDDFQELEANWRGIEFLIRRTEVGPQLKLLLIDVSRDEIFADLQQIGDPTQTGLYQLLVEHTVETAGGISFAALVGLWSFTAEPEHVEVLARIAKIAERAGALCMTQAAPQFLGCSSYTACADSDLWGLPEESDAWAELRRRPEAAYLGLMLPRFLMRLPYGPETDPVERFDFDEFGDTAHHEQFLWGNPALIGACVLANRFSEAGWQLDATAPEEIGNLPFYVGEVDGESAAIPCGETLLTAKVVQAMAERGLMAVVSVRGSDSVMLPGMYSVARTQFDAQKSVIGSSILDRKQ